MTTTVLGIYNAAISAARGKGRLAGLTDNSRERTECDIWYNQVRTQSLEAAYWPSSRATARLNLVAERDQTVDWTLGDPETQYLYSYALPTNCLRPWHLVNFEEFTVSFSESTNQLTLNTNRTDAVLVYSRDQTNPAFWSPGLRLAVIYGLAGAIAGPLTGNSSLQQLNYQLANNALLAARTATASLLQEQLEVVPPAIAVRGYDYEQQTRFLYPFGELFSAAVPDA